MNRFSIVVLALIVALGSAQTVNLVFADLFRGYTSGLHNSHGACDEGFQHAVDSLIELFNTPDALSSSTADLTALAAKYLAPNAVILDADCNSGTISNRLAVFGTQAPAGLALNGTLADGLAAVGVNDTHTVARVISAECRPGAKAGNVLVRWVSNQEDDVENYHFKFDDNGLITVLWYYPNIAASYEAAFNLVN